MRSNSLADWTIASKPVSLPPQRCVDAHPRSHLSHFRCTERTPSSTPSDDSGVLSELRGREDSALAASPKSNTGSEFLIVLLFAATHPLSRLPMPIRNPFTAAEVSPSRRKPRVHPFRRCRDKTRTMRRALASKVLHDHVAHVGHTHVIRGTWAKSNRVSISSLPAAISSRRCASFQRFQQVPPEPPSANTVARLPERMQ